MKGLQWNYEPTDIRMNDRTSEALYGGLIFCLAKTLNAKYENITGRLLTDHSPGNQACQALNFSTRRSSVHGTVVVIHCI